MTPGRLLTLGILSGWVAVSSPTFRPAPGWIVVTPGPPQPSSSVVAVTAADRDVVHPFAPFVGFKRLRPRGIVVWVTTMGRGGRRGWLP